MGFLLILLTVAVIAGRFTVPGQALTGWPGAYESFAHMWVGAMVVLAFYVQPWWFPLTLLGVASAVELAMFLIQVGP